MQRTQIDPRWQDIDVIERLVREARTVAVVGLSGDPRRPSHGVASYLRASGLVILPSALPAFHGLTHGRTPRSRSATILSVTRAYTSSLG